jgi:hypothetical protein
MVFFTFGIQKQRYCLDKQPSIISTVIGYAESLLLSWWEIIDFFMQKQRYP